MRSKDITVGMKVVMVSKSTGQSFESWQRRMKQLDAHYGTVCGWDKLLKCWIVTIIVENGIGAGYFMAKDLIPYQE